MALNHNDQSVIRQYLLGQLSDEEQQELEQRFLIEDDLFEELEISETQLIDEYVAGESDPEERQQFDRHFLTTPARERDLEFARVLKRYVVSQSDSHSTVLSMPQADQPRSPAAQSWWQFGERAGLLRAAAVVALVAIVAVIVWFALPRTSSPRTLATLNLTLTAGNRAEALAVPKVRLPSNGVKLVLKLPDGPTQATNYRARLVTGDGETRMLELAQRDAQSVSIIVSAEELKRGSYAVKLITVADNGSEIPLNGSYLFTVE